MKICSNCKLAGTSVQARTLGISIHSGDQRESSAARHVDFCYECWGCLTMDCLDLFHKRFRPVPEEFKETRDPLL